MFHCIIYPRENAVFSEDFQHVEEAGAFGATGDGDADGMKDLAVFEAVVFGMIAADLFGDGRREGGGGFKRFGDAF